MGVNYDSLQDCCEPWWIEKDYLEFETGRLVWIYFTYFSIIPYELVAKERTDQNGNKDSTEHRYVDYLIKELRIKEKRDKSILPVAGLPLHDKELYVVSKAKKRPALILPNNSLQLPKSITLGRPSWQRHPSILVAPYYGVGSNGKRAGFSEEFVQRVKHCEYPQLLYSKLPFKDSKTEESILFFNHMLSIGKHHDTIELTPYSLSDDAIEILEEYLEWYLFGRLDNESSIIIDFQREFSSLTTFDSLNQPHKI